MCGILFRERSCPGKSNDLRRRSRQERFGVRRGVLFRNINIFKICSVRPVPDDRSIGNSQGFVRCKVELQCLATVAALPAAGTMLLYTRNYLVSPGMIVNSAMSCWLRHRVQ